MIARISLCTTTGRELESRKRASAELSGGVGLDHLPKPSVETEAPSAELLTRDAQ